MTVQAGTEITLELLVGELEELGCEHSQHGSANQNHQDAPATHYVRGYCPCAGWSEAYAACPRFVTFAQSFKVNRCPDCKQYNFAAYMFEVLAPINSSTH